MAKIKDEPAGALVPIPKEDAEDLARSFITVRKAVGYAGALLPILLLLIGFATVGDIEPSMSDFYYTDGRDVFFGTLFAIGGFLLAYTGYRRKDDERLSDRWLARIAGAAVLGVALVPTTGPSLPLAHRILGAGFGGTLHYVCASIFFLCIGLMSYKQFPRGNDHARNKIYRTCGRLIFLSLVLMAATLAARAAFPGWSATSERLKLIFALETVGVLAFAFSWLTKGETLVAQPVVRLVEGLSAA